MAWFTNASEMPALLLLAVVVLVLWLAATLALVGEGAGVASGGEATAVAILLKASGMLPIFPAATRLCSSVRPRGRRCRVVPAPPLLKAPPRHDATTGRQLQKLPLHPPCAEVDVVIRSLPRFSTVTLLAAGDADGVYSADGARAPAAAAAAAAAAVAVVAPSGDRPGCT